MPRCYINSFSPWCTEAGCSESPAPGAAWYDPPPIHRSEISPLVVRGKDSSWVLYTSARPFSITGRACYHRYKRSLPKNLEYGVRQLFLLSSGWVKTECATSTPELPYSESTNSEPSAEKTAYAIIPRVCLLDSLQTNVPLNVA